MGARANVVLGRSGSSRAHTDRRSAGRYVTVRARRLEAELAVRGLATPLLAGSEALFLKQFLRIGDFGLVDVPASNAACELPVPVVLDNHQPATTRAPVRRRTSDHSYTPVFGRPGRNPSGLGLDQCRRG